MSMRERMNRCQRKLTSNRPSVIETAVSPTLALRGDDVSQGSDPDGHVLFSPLFVPIEIYCKSDGEAPSCLDLVLVHLPASLCRPYQSDVHVYSSILISKVRGHENPERDLFLTRSISRELCLDGHFLFHTTVVV